MIVNIHFLIYNLAMNKTNRQIIKQMTSEIMGSVFDNIVDIYSDAMCAICDSLENVPEPEREAVIKSVIESQKQMLMDGFKAGIPPDFESKLKEAVNGRR